MRYDSVTLKKDTERYISSNNQKQNKKDVKIKGKTLLFNKTERITT